MRSLVVAAAAVLFAASASADEPVVIPLENYLNTLSAMHAAVGGHDGLFLFDTGEGISALTPQFAAKIGCKPWGQVTGYRMSGERADMPRCDSVTFAIGGARFTAPIAGVFDINTLLPKESPVDGSLGLDIFAGQTVTIEPHASRIVVETPESLAARIRGATEIPARIVRDAEGVALEVDAAVKTPAGQAWMELDTGNGGTLVVANHIAPLFGLKTGQKEPQPASFELAGGGITVSGDARVRDLIMDGNIGKRFLDNWNLTLDLAHGRAWLAKAEY
jgi:Aspartyl protease